VSAAGKLVPAAVVVEQPISYTN
jgi:hypothetical protein